MPSRQTQTAPSQGSLFDTAIHEAGNHSVRLPASIVATAVYGGENDRYRYRLDYIWNAAGPAALWLMMNPSTATEHNSDRTVERVRAFSERWGYGRAIVVNTMAYRATDQGRLTEIADPQGPENLRHILAAASECDIIIAAYGQPKHRKLSDYGPRTLQALRERGHRIHALGLTSDGRPRHPLYISGSAAPFELA